MLPSQYGCEPLNCNCFLYTYVVLRRQIARCKNQFTVTDFYKVKLFCKNQSNPKS